MKTLPEIEPATVQVIIHNPNADFEHRFFYIKMDVGHYDEIISTFTWHQDIDPYGEPVFYRMPLRPEDAAFWENTAAMPRGISIVEYEMPSEMQNESPSKTIFREFIPYDVSLDRYWTKDNTDSTSKKLSINEQLLLLGYETIGEPPPQHLFNEGELLIENVIRVSDIYSFTSDTDLIWAFTVDTRDVEQSDSGGFNSYLVENDVVTDRGYNSLDPGFPPILHKGELLWVRAPEYYYAQVQKSDGYVEFSFATYRGAHVPINRFTNWDDHWILEVSNFVIQDGEILNELYGFEETFNWFLVNDKPIYFFRKGQRVGISYDG